MMLDLKEETLDWNIDWWMLDRSSSSKSYLGDSTTLVVEDPTYRSEPFFISLGDLSSVS